MPAVNSLQVVRLGHQLNVPFKLWLRQQAAEMVRLRGLGFLREKRLTEAITQKFAMQLPVGSPAFPALVALVRALVLEEEIRKWEEKLNSIGDDAQLANVELQDILQRQQQILQMMSNISKSLYDTAQAVIRKMGV